MSSPAELLEVLRGPGASADEARDALHALGHALELADLERLLLDPGVLRHGAAEVRRDAACALGVFGTRSAAALLPLLDDDDVTVARAAWISLWTATGRAFGLESEAEFQAPPPQPDDLEADRAALFARPGVSAIQRVETEAMLRDEERRAEAARRFRELLGEPEVGRRTWPKYQP